MNCCVNCFADQGLRSRIEAESSKVGDCDFCETKAVVVISCEGLSDIFSSLFELYANHPIAILSLKEDLPFAIHEHLERFWPRLFNLSALKAKDIKHLINQIGRGWSGFSDELFEEPVELQSYLNGKLEDEMYSLQWEGFAEEIKEQNRFFIGQTLDLDLLESTFERLVKTYPAGSTFYRARISTDPLPAKVDITVRIVPAISVSLCQ